MLIRNTTSERAALLGDALASQVTPAEVFWNRRQWLQASGGVAAAAALPAMAQNGAAYGMKPLAAKPSSLVGARVKAEPTEQKHALTYNNFYEFGLGKDDPEERAQAMRIEPWAVRVEGLVHKPQTFSLDALLKLAPMEERIYRFRCVEAWSMVVPWLGYSLSHVLNAVQPMASGKYVSLVTTLQPEAMPGLRFGGIEWPYQEGLRMDEAMHPLTMLVFGMYGQTLAKQSGAPLRLIVPWKYGFKSAKSLVTIRVSETMPKTAWSVTAPHEYGFYANVNPEVNHPRWSQASERALGGGLFAKREPTRMFNGYSEQVASLYAGMDLRKHY